ncbi:MAG: bifunctional methylenetetrahydrofolate dehydrogenase/methenyltetrahydrofolate cyclohydrolase FolD [Prevotellaceae bacterium]|jgi:methylenetetrahydrofolate dehydrogenase (NADP+)/methenyltetrahydrofolate cyclohydrolase|nr:bifunctional methylenetetrahydrofolate dehydrogenase/methenyltetrahydrofolate cyclohydrolase FolD [Prevotellaceae bacterium]
MEIIDGKKTSAAIKAEVTAEVAKMKSEGKRTPGLAAILVGNDPASGVYVGRKEKDCKEVGFHSLVLRLPETITEEELLAEIKKLNTNPDIDGIIVQLPLPKHISEQKVIETIDYKKDVDGFHPINVGRMVIGLPSYVSATPFGIVELLARYKIETAGKNCVVLGRSNIVGRPVANLLSQKGNSGDCTVTICHSRTKNLNEICKAADIIVAAMGIPEFLKADMVSEGAVVIDVGITRVENAESKAKLVGDVKYDEAAPKCSYITPVPGGVGPMTRAALLQNTLKAAKKEIYG